MVDINESPLGMQGVESLDLRAVAGGVGWALLPSRTDLTRGQTFGNVVTGIYPSSSGSWAGTEMAIPEWHDPVVEGDADLRMDTVEVHRAVQQFLRVYQFRDRDRICCHDVSVTQCHALEQLVEAGPISQGELAAALYLDKSTTSRVVSALERKGYVNRTQDTQDLRAHRLEVTPAGRALIERIEGDILAREARLLSGFAPEVRRAMAQLIQELAKVQAANIDSTDGTCCTVG